MEIQKSEYLEIEKSFLDEINKKHLFSFCRAIIFGEKQKSMNELGESQRTS